MKEIIPFSKDIKFNTKIYEIVSISLENTLSVNKDNTVDGEFIISGDYKMNDSSVNTEPFIYGLPFDITLDDKYDTNKIKIDIDDFKFEIINEEILRVNIDVLVEGVEKVEIIDEITPDVIIEAREEKILDENICEYTGLDEDDGKEINMNENVSDLFKEEEQEAIMVNKPIESNIDKKVTSIFENFDSKDEQYVSYYVHIVRENDTIDSISMKYGITKDELKEYNNIDEIMQGNKLIIPFINTDETI